MYLEHIKCVPYGSTCRNQQS